MIPLEYTWLRFTSWLIEIGIRIGYLIALFIFFYIISKVKPEWL